MPEDKEIVSVRGLGMRFGGLKALDGIDLSIKAGQITAVIGPNGAGKTTAFNCITGFYKPTSGKVVMTHPGGQLIHLDQMGRHEVARRARVARTFQNIRLFSGMSVLENLMVAQNMALMPNVFTGVAQIFGLSFGRRTEVEAIEKSAAWLKRIGLLDRADEPAGSLPYGDQKRLEIARAMCLDPLLLCLDEPAAGLNPRESGELATLLCEIRDEGCSVVMIEHDMSVVMNISDYVVVLDHGVKISEGIPAVVRADPNVVAAYLGQEEEEVAND